MVSTVASSTTLPRHRPTIFSQQTWMREAVENQRTFIEKVEKTPVNFRAWVVFEEYKKRHKVPGNFGQIYCKYTPCPKRRTCWYAHNLEEYVFFKTRQFILKNGKLLQIPTLWKSKPCSEFRDKGRCHLRAHCPYGHPENLKITYSANKMHIEKLSLFTKSDFFICVQPSSTSSPSPNVPVLQRIPKATPADLKEGKESSTIDDESFSFDRNEESILESLGIA